MRGSTRTEVLAGLVSTEAAVAYERLHAASRLPVGEGPEAFDPEAPAERELQDAGVISFGGSGSARFARAVPPAVALRRLLDRQHRRISELQADLAGTWERFTALVAPTGGLTSVDGGGVRAIQDHDELTRLASGLYRSPRRLLRATFTGSSGGHRVSEGVLLPPADALEAGAEFRMIYDAAHAHDGWGARSIRQSTEAGEQARVRKSVPVRMMHVDDTVALVTTDRTGAAGALQVHSPELLKVLAEWFDALWDAPDTVPLDGADVAELTPVRRRVLSLLAAGLTDEAIARSTGTGERTVRRHVCAILEILQVESRFAAGVAAAKRGWV
ncbi:LuxR C-terminal-related transcriptional regulator [Amycolatopsis rhabdoformis]|uniref:LuxR C-terminal-related transcriptional regulator n=1 Tax=Amycolatopsis rhabdoformis TaxID=1448059 RepID=A0ABZ1IB17_9PSEU|nr:LuxR C-terminal-related transcriptional regulator [Amycolatopsis rhabdoformis]WSE30926.1 LuxR C-terminal-related transcriptional regulator [Amycolatopsis rhabdoformis]